MLQNNNFSFNVGGHILDLSSPSVMTIINATPDSFYQGSRKQGEAELLDAVSRAINEGTSVLDLGGYSTRPGAEVVTVEEEVLRVGEALKTIKSSFGTLPVALSIDTFRSEVVKCALDIWGAVIVNDISAGEDCPLMLETVANNKLAYIAMHKKGNPQTMCKLTDYNSDIVSNISSYFVKRLKLFKSYGIKDVMLDIGFGFAKNHTQNFELIRRYNEFNVLGQPTLAGISRKRMVWQTLEVGIDEALNGTSILHAELLRQGANMLRVHDTKEAVQAIKLHNELWKQK